MKRTMSGHDSTAKRPALKQAAKSGTFAGKKSNKSSAPKNDQSLKKMTDQKADSRQSRQPRGFLFTPFAMQEGAPLKWYLRAIASTFENITGEIFTFEINNIVILEERASVIDFALGSYAVQAGRWYPAHGWEDFDTHSALATRLAVLNNQLVGQEWKQLLAILPEKWCEENRAILGLHPEPQGPPPSVQSTSSTQSNTVWADEMETTGATTSYADKANPKSDLKSSSVTFLRRARRHMSLTDSDMHSKRDQSNDRIAVKKTKQRVGLASDVALDNAFLLESMGPGIRQVMIHHQLEPEVHAHYCEKLELDDLPFMFQVAKWRRVPPVMFLDLTAPGGNVALAWVVETAVKYGWELTSLSSDGRTSPYEPVSGDTD